MVFAVRWSEKLDLLVSRVFPLGFFSSFFFFFPLPHAFAFKDLAPMMDSNDSEEQHWALATEEDATFAPKRDSYPMCIVWSVIPVLTWLLPPAGHLGIAASDGTISDFAGPHYIHQSKKRTAFGPVNKYIRVAPSDITYPPDMTAQQAWNKAIDNANRVYQTRMHNLILDNCHHHTAVVLNELQYKGSKRWGTVSLIVHMMLHAPFVSSTRCLKTYIPTLIILFLAALLIVLIELL